VQVEAGTRSALCRWFRDAPPLRLPYPLTDRRVPFSYPTVHRIVSLLPVLLVAVFTAACATVPTRPSTEGAEFERRCAPPPQTASFTLERDATDGQTTASGELTGRFSNETLSIANVLGVLSHLEDLSRQEREGRHRSLEFIETRLALSDRLFLALFEINGMVAEITCERDRADQVADRMEESDAGTVRNLTLASVLIGGVASIVSGAVGLAGASSVAVDASTLGGGVLASIFGGTALFTESHHPFRHERNLLKDLWENADNSTLFSPTVWRYLHAARLDGNGTPREEIMKAWQQEGRLGEPGSKNEDRRKTLFFSAGGMYTASELRARASMLETLEASVRLINERLELFVREVMFTGGAS
jgi:hypothetical protein